MTDICKLNIRNHTIYMRKLLVLFIFSICIFKLDAQYAISSPQRLKVFIDCNNTYCDMDFIRTEINILDFYLDRLAADVHILITDQRTGGQGRQYQMLFFGLNRFKNMTDTMLFSTEPNLTEFERRDVFIKHLKLGLVPYLAKTGLVKNINIDLKNPELSGTQKDENLTKDPWNYWVFRASVSGNVNGESVYKSTRFSSSLSAQRTTDKIKINFEIDGSKNNSKYEFVDDQGVLEKFTVKNNNYGFEHSIVFSLSNKWSYGYELDYNSSTFSNNKGRASMRTAIEYNFYPYTEVNSRYLAVHYGLSARRNKYYDTTIYDKLKETLYGHFVNLEMSYTKKWGSLYGGVEYNNFFHDWSLNNLEINLGTNFRITGGLSFNIHTNYNLVHDQVYLPKGGATEQEILTRRRQLQTNFQYYIGFGLNYRFGSNLNNFINPRFNGPN